MTMLDLRLDDILDDQEEFENHGKLRTIPLGNNILKMESVDPYGFWYLSLAKGKMPPQFAGAYTSFSRAFNAAKEYVRSRNLDVHLDKKGEPLPAKVSLEK